MNATTPFCSDTFRLVAKGLIALHQLDKEGKDDSPDAEGVRDSLDLPLRALNRIENERSQWLSEDLYSTHEPAVALLEMNSLAQQHLNEAFEARQNREWDRALVVLRKWREHIAPELLSYLRGAIWLEAGNPEIATVFYRHAAELAPFNGNFQTLHLISLSKSNPAVAKQLANDVLAEDEKHDPMVVAQAAAILRFDGAKPTWDAATAQQYQQLLPILERNLKRLETDNGTQNSTSAYAGTVSILGMCHEFLGNTGAAVQYYSQGIRVQPNNDGLLVARGMLLFGTSLLALADFELAVRLGSPVVWPYLFLAHHYLLTNQFDSCRHMCEAGLRKQASGTAHSQLEEWRAIAQAELGFPPDMVRAAFEAAIRFDPSNELAKRNLALFEASLESSQATLHNAWEQQSAAGLRQFGLAERRHSLAA